MCGNFIARRVTTLEKNIFFLLSYFVDLDA